MIALGIGLALARRPADTIADLAALRLRGEATAIAVPCRIRLW